MLTFYLYGAKLRYWDLHQKPGKDPRVTFNLDPQPEPWRIRRVFTGIETAEFVFQKCGTVPAPASMQMSGSTSPVWLSVGLVEIPWHITCHFTVSATQVAVMCGVKDVLFLTRDLAWAKEFSCRSCPHELACRLDPNVQHPFGPTYQERLPL